MLPPVNNKLLVWLRAVVLTPQIIAGPDPFQPLTPDPDGDKRRGAGQGGGPGPNRVQNDTDSSLS